MKSRCSGWHKITGEVLIQIAGQAGQILEEFTIFFNIAGSLFIFQNSRWDSIHWSRVMQLMKQALYPQATTAGFRTGFVFHRTFCESMFDCNHVDIDLLVLLKLNECCIIVFSSKLQPSSSLDKDLSVHDDKKDKKKFLSKGKKQKSNLEKCFRS